MRDFTGESIAAYGENFDAAIDDRRNRRNDSRIPGRIKNGVSKGVLYDSPTIPKDMLQDIDMVARESGRTRNEIVTMFLDFA